MGILLVSWAVLYLVFMVVGVTIRRAMDSAHGDKPSAWEIKHRDTKP